MQQPLGAELGIAHAAKVNLLKTMRAVCSRDNEKLHLLYPDYRHRASVLKQAEALLPEETFDYEISLTYTEDNLTLDADDRAFVKQFILQDFRSSPPEENVELTGILYSIEVLTGKPHIGILSGHRKIACYFNKEYEDVVRDLMPGSLVEVEGWATFTDKGLIDTIETLYDVRPVQIFPLRIKRIRFEGRIFHLNDSIHVEVNYVDGVYVAEYKALNIMGYGPTRNEALNHFKLDFVLIWDELVQEEDDLLTSDAIDLKNKVKQLVSSFEWVDSN